MSSARPSPAKPSTKGQRAFIAAAILLFAALSAYLAIVIITRVDSIFLPPGRQITLGPVGNAIPGVDSGGTSGSQERINILVMGLDRRASEGDAPTRTDSLFVVTVDPKTKTTGILGIPRDLRVDIPGKQGGTYQDKVNTVYVAGELGRYPDGGVGLLKQVLADSPFNIKIDKYVIIDLKGFESIIDDLGGIEVDVPDEVYDPYYSETERPGDYFPVHFYPGTQHMDGAHALAYSRIRFSSDDLDRIQRQQRVIFAAIEKANSLNVLKNAPSLWSKYKDAVKTDVDDYEISKYAILANDVKDNIHAISLGPATTPWNDPTTGAAYLLGSEDGIQQIVESIFSDAPSAGAPTAETPEPVRVQVQNGTSTEGLARAIVGYIIGRGYPQHDLNPANVYDGLPHSRSEIIDVYGTNRQNAYLIADWLKIDPSRVRDATPDEKVALSTNPAEIVVVLGSDVDFGELIQSPTTSVPGG